MQEIHHSEMQLLGMKWHVCGSCILIQSLCHNNPAGSLLWAPDTSPSPLKHSLHNRFGKSGPSHPEGHGGKSTQPQKHHLLSFSQGRSGGGRWGMRAGMELMEEQRSKRAWGSTPELQAPQEMGFDHNTPKKIPKMCSGLGTESLAPFNPHAHENL